MTADPKTPATSRRLAQQLRARLGTRKAQLTTPLLWPHRVAACRMGRGRPPDFIIVGAQRSGSRSLYHYLTELPGVAGSRAKEVHYFDLRFDRDLSWYLSYFPLRIGRNQPTIVGEKSPYYLFHPHVPQRIAETLPDVRLIILLRNPVDRALSHYASNVVLGLEHRSFADALDAEPAMVQRETERITAAPDYNSFEHRHHSYFSRGEYAAQLRRYRELFPAERMLIIKSERLFDQPERQLRTLHRYLGLVEATGAIDGMSHLNRSISGRGVDPAVRAALVDRYSAPNRDLAQLVDFSIEDWR